MREKPMWVGEVVDEPGMLTTYTRWHLERDSGRRGLNARCGAFLWVWINWGDRRKPPGLLCAQCQAASAIESAVEEAPARADA